MREVGVSWWWLIGSSTRVNYASNLGTIHGVEAMVCLATNGVSFNGEEEGKHSESN